MRAKRILFIGLMAACLKGCYMVTRGQRRLGRTIRKLENSVELSTKESKAKESERKYLEKVRKLAGYTDDSPIQSLRDPFIHKKDFKDDAF